MDAAAVADGVTIPDILAAPMIRLVVVLSMPAVVDVHIDGRRAANVVVRRGCAGQLEEPLLLEGPPDHLHVGASGLSFQRVQRIPIRRVGGFEHLLEFEGRRGVRRRRQRADPTEDKIDGEPRGELLGTEIRRIAADGPVEPEQRRRQNRLVVVPLVVKRRVERVQGDAALPSPARGGRSVVEPPRGQRKGGKREGKRFEAVRCRAAGIVQDDRDTVTSTV